MRNEKSAPRGVLTVGTLAMALVFLVAVPGNAQDTEAPVELWLSQDVVYIIEPEEVAAFESLDTAEEQAMFIAQFWQRRDPTPGTVANEYREEHYRRLADANERFASEGVPGWQTDRGQILIKYGEPDRLEVARNGGLYERTPAEGGGVSLAYPYEAWHYNLIEGVGTMVTIDFVDDDLDGTFRSAETPFEKDALANR